MEIKTESIKVQLDLQFDNLTEENLNSVESITINRYNATGLRIEVEYNDLLYFPNLKSLTINDCILNTELMEILCSLKLEELYLFNCETFQDIEYVISSLNLNTLVLDNTELNLNLLDSINIPNLTLANIDFPITNIYSNTLNISKINNIKTIENINVKELIINEKQYQYLKPIMGNIKYVVIDSYGEKVEGV